MQACFAIFSSLLHGSELSQKKSLLTRLCCQKDDVFSFTAVPPILFFQTTSFDDNGITGPDWGRSELVFDHVPAKTLAPPDGVSLCHIRCDLLVSSTLCFFASIAFSALDIFRLYHPFSGCQVLHWLKLYFSGVFCTSVCMASFSFAFSGISSSPNA